MNRVIVRALALCILASTTAFAESDESARRATIPNVQARIIAGELFPDKCGHNGERCGITYDDERGCPFEFVIIFPAPESAEAAEPSRAWVTLNNRGGVVAVGSKPRTGSCRNARS